MLNRNTCSGTEVAPEQCARGLNFSQVIRTEILVKPGRCTGKSERDGGTNFVVGKPRQVKNSSVAM